MDKEEMEKELITAIETINNLSHTIQKVPIVFDEVKKCQEHLEQLVKTIYKGNGQKAVITTLATHSREHEHADKRMSSHQDQIDWLREALLEHMKNEIHDRKDNAKVQKIFTNKVKITLLSAFLTVITGVAVKFNWPEISAYLINLLQ